MPIIYILVCIAALMFIVYVTHTQNFERERNHMLHYMFSGTAYPEVRSIEILAKDDDVLKIVSALVCLIEKQNKSNVIYWLDGAFG